MANTIINFKRGNGLNIMDPDSNPTGLSNTVLNDSSYTLGPHSIETASPWFNKEAYQFWVDGVCINPALVPGKGISLGDLEWEEDVNHNPTSKLINTINVKLSRSQGNALVENEDGLFVATSTTGATTVYRFNTFNDYEWNTSSYSDTVGDAGLLGDITFGLFIQEGSQITSVDADGDPQTTTTWGTFPTDINSLPFRLNITGQNLESSFYYTMPGLAERQGTLDFYHHGYVFNIKAITTDSTGNTTYGVTNLTIPKNIVLKTPNEETYTFYSGTQAVATWTIPTEAERFAKSMNIVPITIDPEGSYWDRTTIEGDEGDEDYVGPTQVTVDNSNNVIGRITTGANVIRLEVANADGDSPHYLYLGIEGLFSYKTLSATDHSLTGLYVITGSGYDQNVDPLITLREDGSWQTIPVFGGATAPTNTSMGISGTSGLVPAPSPSEANYVLRGDGSWAPLSLDALNYTTQDSSSDTYNGINIQLNDSSDLLHWWKLKSSNQSGDTSINFNASVEQTTGSNPINFPTIELMIDVIDGGSF